MRNLPRPSMRCASAGTLTEADGPSAVMRPSRTITVCPVRTRSRSIGSTLTSTNANVPATGVDTSRAGGVESVGLLITTALAGIALARVEARSADRKSTVRLGMELFSLAVGTLRNDAWSISLYRDDGDNGTRGHGAAMVRWCEQALA